MRIWILVLLLAPFVYGQNPSAVYHDNVVMVVDASGSMDANWSGTNNDKMKIAKEAMKTVLAQIDENTRIGIVVFGRVQNEWVYPLGLKNNEALLAAIDSISTGGGTPLGTFIKKGADALVEQRKRQFGYGSYRLLIVTDGEASGGGEERMMREYTAEIMARGINVDVIGVDMGSEHALAQIVGDNYRAADNPEALTKAITEVFAEVSKTGDGGKADFELLEGLDPALAKDMIRALAKPQNHPIGEKPRSTVKQISSATGESTWQVEVTQPSDGFSSTLVGIGIFLVAGIIVFIAVKNS